VPDGVVVRSSPTSPCNVSRGSTSANPGSAASRVWRTSLVRQEEREQLAGWNDDRDSIRAVFLPRFTLPAKHPRAGHRPPGTAPASGARTARSLARSNARGPARLRSVRRPPRRGHQIGRPVLGRSTSLFPQTCLPVDGSKLSRAASPRSARASASYASAASRCLEK
jgi:hypothetical protein